MLGFSFLQENMIVKCFPMKQFDIQLGMAIVVGISTDVDTMYIITCHKCYSCTIHRICVGPKYYVKYY